MLVWYQETADCGPRVKRLVRVLVLVVSKSIYKHAQQSADIELSVVRLLDARYVIKYRALDSCIGLV